MLKNLILTTLRSLSRNKFYSFINVFGLAIGIASCLIIWMYVDHQFSYNRFHENGPMKVVLSEETAIKLFGSVSNAVGKTITIRQALMTVTAVAGKPPENSSIQFDMLVSFLTFDHSDVISPPGVGTG